MADKKKLTKKQRDRYQKVLRARRAVSFKARKRNAKVVTEERKKMSEEEFLSHDFNWNAQKLPWWERARKATLKRDRSACRICGALSMPDQPLHVHHIVPRRWPGSGEQLRNLATLCPPCHREVDVELWRRLEGTTHNYSPDELRRACEGIMREVGGRIRKRRQAS